MLNERKMIHQMMEHSKDFSQRIGEFDKYRESLDRLLKGITVNLEELNKEADIKEKKIEALVKRIERLESNASDY